MSRSEPTVLEADETGSLKKVYKLLGAGERRRGLLVFALMVVNAAIDTAGVASILPFLAVLGKPELIQTNPILNWAFVTLGFSSVERFMMFLAAASIVMVVGSSIVRSITEYSTLFFLEMRRHALGSRLLRRYLRQPYPFFLNRNSADLSKGILSEVDEVVVNAFYPALMIPAYGLVSLGLIALLVAVDPVMAAVVVVVVGGAYVGIFMGIARMIRRKGQEKVKANRDRFLAAAEAFGGIKDIKLLGREEVYIERFRVPSLRFSRHQALAKALAAVPRYLIEAVGFGGILGLSVFLMATGRELGGLLPLLGLYAFAGYRLLPAAQQLYANFTKLRFGIPAVEHLYRDLEGLAPHTPTPGERRRLELKRGITWSGVTFRYAGCQDAALNGLSLMIPARSTVAFVGQTGAGKTTAVDLILGLLRPTEGEIRIDEQVLEEETLRSWQNSIGYVSQHIYLADDTIAANIAFGVPAADIDREAVMRAANLAQLHDFIVDQLPSGYDTVVGERGVRLSGGQRQRLGIARALYTDPSVLVLDEATSALDSVTESAVMDAVHGLEGAKTIIVIAHRLTTVQHADLIFLLEQGRLVDTGTFTDLADRNVRFRAMAAGVAG